MTAARTHDRSNTDPLSRTLESDISDERPHLFEPQFHIRAERFVRSAQYLSRSHRDTEAHENEIGTLIGEALMKDGISRIVYGAL